MANAGRVAIVPKGDYSSSTAYKRLDLVRYNDKAYVAKKANTGIVPTNTEYWMLMTSDGIVIDSALSDSSTNAVQNKVLKSALDSIQTTSKATLSQAGWYRVAEYPSSTDGFPAHSCELIIKKAYSYNGADFHHLRFVLLPTNKCAIQCLGSATHLVQGITKARHTLDAANNKSYLEIYYSLNSKNLALFNIENGNSAQYYWQAITPTLTSETVSGVTITTTYDIPANAKPVTDLDLVRFEGETLSTSILEKAVELPIGEYNFILNGGSYTGGDLPNTLYAYGCATVHKRGVGAITVELHGSNSLVAQPTAKNFYDGTNWLGWVINATISDLTTALAGYLPKTGGAVEGSLTVGTINDTDNRTLYLFNNARRIMLRVNSNGSFDFYDITHDKSIINSIPEGTNTFNGTATGNLALDALSFSTTAPSNTSALWVDTANKVIKAYIDGAWTQVS